MKLGVIMDPIAGINIKKDSTFAMLLAAQDRGWEIHYMEQNDLSIQENEVKARTKLLSVAEDYTSWYEFGNEATINLPDLDVVLMRVDPPFDIEYIYTTYILQFAQAKGLLVINDPAGLRNVNEKMYINTFPDCIAPTLVTRNKNNLTEFLKLHKQAVFKPLEGMGGKSVFVVTYDDPNTNVIIETLTHDQSRFIMAQRYIPEIKDGDKRILLINGEPVEYALARIPKSGETRGNLAAGGAGKGVDLSERDRWICNKVGPVVKEMGLLFVGLDVIGDYLTEVNVTSPTCIRELDAIYGLKIGDQLMTMIDKLVNGQG